jgi:hypothetical protein
MSSFGYSAAAREQMSWPNRLICPVESQEGTMSTKVQRILNSLHLSPIDFSLPRTPELSWEAEELERQLQSKLNLPLRYYRGRDHASSSGAIGDEVIGLRKDRMVESIEEFGSKLKSEPFCHIEHFSR